MVILSADTAIQVGVHGYSRADFILGLLPGGNRRVLVIQHSTTLSTGPAWGGETLGSSGNASSANNVRVTAIPNPFPVGVELPPGGCRALGEHEHAPRQQKGMGRSNRALSRVSRLMFAVTDSSHVRRGPGSPVCSHPRRQPLRRSCVPHGGRGPMIWGDRHAAA